MCCLDVEYHCRNTNLIYLRAHRYNCRLILRSIRFGHLIKYFPRFYLLPSFQKPHPKNSYTKSLNEKHATKRVLKYFFTETEQVSLTTSLKISRTTNALTTFLLSCSNTVYSRRATSRRKCKIHLFTYIEFYLDITD